MVPPVSHYPSAHEMRELHAIALDTARDALFLGWASSSFHGFQIYAHSWTSLQGMRLRVVVCDEGARLLLSQEHLHGQGLERCEPGCHQRNVNGGFGTAAM